MDIKKSLGKRIREIRISHAMTQESLSEKINLSAKSLSQIELGNNFVSAETLDSLCMALNVTPKVLFDIADIEDDENIKPMEEIVKRLNNNPALLKIIYKIVVALD